MRAFVGYGSSVNNTRVDPGDAHAGIIFVLPVHLVRSRPPVPAGASLLALCAIAAKLRFTNEMIDPVVVRRDASLWLLEDGNLRWLAHWIAGRPFIRCVESPAAVLDALRRRESSVATHPAGGTRLDGGGVLHTSDGASKFP